MSKIVILGISGRAGSRIANELLARGHEVTGLARHVDKLAARENLRLEAVDVLQAEQLVASLRGHDAVISSTRFAEGLTAPALMQAARTAGVARVIVVGGAGSLEVAPGQALIDLPDFPPAYKPEASAGRVFLQALRTETAPDWTFISPSAEFEPGTRSGQFRLGTDQLLVDADGRSHVSMEDFAIALADELEQPGHLNQRFTVGY